MKRSIWKAKPCNVRRDAPKETMRIASAVGKLTSNLAYSEAVLETIGPDAIETAKRGRTLRELARATRLSPAYLSLVANGRQRISLAALHVLLRQCEGVER
jgi:hypothetical protein